MKVKPVSVYKVPEYPGLEEFLRDPGLLSKNVPANWRNNGIVWAALVSFTLGSPGIACSQKKQPRIELIRIHEHDTALTIGEFEEAGDSSFIAPLFRHGNGIGAYGCVMIMPPVFITEQEAKQIILNELKKENLVFDTNAQPTHKVVVKTKKTIWEKVKGKYNTRDTVEHHELKFDGYNKELNFAFCFVSKEKYRVFSDYEPENSSVSHEDYIKTGEKLRAAISKTNAVNAVIFYEPIPYPDWKDRSVRPDRDQWKTEGKKVAIDSLKAQVADFARWLHAEQITKQ